VRDEPPELIRGDYVASLPSLLAERVDGAQLVVYETASTQYLDRAAREALHEALHHAGREEPLTFLTTRSSPDRDFYTLEAVAWPSGRRCALLHLDFHGAWLEWLGDTG
jgi:hypothetical protein